MVSQLTDPLKYYRCRLAIHKRTMRYWSGLPDFSGFGPTGKNLRSGHMALQYERACCDAESIAHELAKLGEKVEVVDIKRTFKVRWNDPSHPPILLYPRTA